MLSPFESVVNPQFVEPKPFQYFSADEFPIMHPIHWLHSHFAVGGWSPLQRLSGMLTAHMTRIAPRNGFTWHPHRGLEIYTWVIEGKIYHEDTTGGAGEIQTGELQRMFSGDWIEHQELNLWDDPTRVIQIWFVAKPEYMGLEPHYQQVSREQLPARQNGEATVYDLIGGDSPMDSHVYGRLTATTLKAGGQTLLEAPHEDEEAFIYFTDGEGQAQYEVESYPLGQYDVLLATPQAKEIQISAQTDLHYLNFYLPRFLPYSSER